MAIFFNPDTGQFVPIPDDAATQLGFSQEQQDPLASQPPPEPPPAPEPDLTPFQTDQSLGDAGTLAPPEVAPPQMTAPAPTEDPGAIPPLPVGASVGGGYKVRYNPNQPPPAPDYSPYLKQYTDASTQASNALGRAEGAIDANTAQGKVLRDEQAGYATQAQADRDDLAKQRNAAIAASEQRVRDAVDAVPQADPGKAFRNFSSFDKGLLIAASALNGFNVRFNHGKNNIADTLQNIAEQDMAAQKINIDTAKEKVYREERGYDRQNAQWSQKMHDYDLGVIQRMSAWDKQLAALEANTQSEINKANLGVQRAAISQRIAELGMGIAQREDQRAVGIWEKQFQERSANWRAALAAQPKPGKPEKVPLPFAQSPFNKRDIELGVDVSEGEAKTVRENYSSASDLLLKAKNYLRLREKIGRKYRGLGEDLRGIKDDDKAALDQAAGQVFYAIRKDATGAAASKQEDDVVRAIQGSPDGFLNGSSLAATKGLVKSLSEERRVMHSTYKIRYADDKKPVDVYSETASPEEVDITKSANPLKASKDAMIEVMTTQDPEAGLSALGAMADYAASTGSNAALLAPVISGAFKTPDGAVDVSEAGAGAKTKTQSAATHVEAVSRIKTEALRLSAIAKANGNPSLAKEILAEGDRVAESLFSKSRPALKRERGAAHEWGWMPDNGYEPKPD